LIRPLSLLPYFIKARLEVDRCMFFVNDIDTGGIHDPEEANVQEFILFAALRRNEQFDVAIEDGMTMPGNFAVSQNDAPVVAIDRRKGSIRERLYLGDENVALRDLQ